jgi:NAD(P)-dependent dehydrogenase (short-subunit alcohol dehydrogenase family)
MQLAGRKVLVVGASSGIGRAIARHSVAQGASVAFAARRQQNLEEAVAEAGGGIAIAGDVRNESDCRRIVDETVAAFGGLDLVVFTAARVALKRFTEVDAATWRELFETNAIGAFLVFSAALPHLGERGIAAYLSTIGVNNPYHGRGAYVASKAALDTGIRALRMEHPRARITRIMLAPTSGTEVAARDDKALAWDLMTDWIRYGRVPDRMLEADSLGRFIVELLSSALRYSGEIEELAIDSGWQPVEVPVDRQAVVDKLALVRKSQQT